MASVEDLVQCPVCLDRMEDPRVLPCQHSYCKKCLEPMVDRSRISCPTCRESHYVPFGGVERFPKNFTIAALLDDLHLSSPSVPALKALCQVCKINNIYVECRHCEKIVCSRCHLEHTKILATELEKESSRIEKIIDMKQKVIDKRERTTKQRVSITKSNAAEARSAIKNWRDQCLDRVHERAEMMLGKVEMAERRMLNPYKELDSNRNEFGFPSWDHRTYEEFIEYVESMKTSQGIAKRRSASISRMNGYDESNDELQKEVLELIKKCKDFSGGKWKCQDQALKEQEEIVFRQEEADKILQTISTFDGIFERKKPPSQMTSLERVLAMNHLHSNPSLRFAVQMSRRILCEKP